MTLEELLKEVGEPVLYAELAEEPHALFTFDQVAAAILKATKPLEDQLAAAQEEIEQLRAALDAKSVLHLDAEKSDLRDQLTAAQKEMNVWRNQAHQSQSAYDRLQDQLAKAEQRVAEACAQVCDFNRSQRWNDDRKAQSKLDATDIRSGQWRKFVKEV